MKKEILYIKGPAKGQTMFKNEFVANLLVKKGFAEFPKEIKVSETKELKESETKELKVSQTKKKPVGRKKKK